MFDEAIEEQNEGSKQTDSLTSQDITPTNNNTATPGPE
jgi:hypothetical protein